MKFRDSGSIGSSKCVVYDNGKSTCSIKCKSCILKGKHIVGHYCHFIFIGKQYSSSQIKDNPESAEFCCLHICLFNNEKAIHFRTTLTPLFLFFRLFIYFICMKLNRREAKPSDGLISYK